MELEHGIRHRQDKTHPSWRVSAVLFSRQCQQLSTRLRWLILCPCGQPGRLHSQLFLFTEMTPHPGGPTLRLGLQTDDPGRQSDGPGLLWEEPGGWTTRESPLGPVLQSQGLHQLIHLPDRLLLWISLRLWILRTRLSRDPFPTIRMKTAITRRSRQPSISCSGRLLRLPRDHSKSTPPRHTGRPGHCFWIWATVRLQIGYRGWTSLLSKTRWLLLPVLPKG